MDSRICLAVGGLLIGLSAPVALSSDAPTNATPFEVTGRVVDPTGNGISGVRIIAHCGIGSLFPTGQTTSGPDGHYLLRFAPGVLMKRGVGLQVATISPSKPGLVETNLHRQGDLLMADRLPQPGQNPGWKVRPERIVLPHKPFQLDFVMIPAGSIKGRLLDSSERPLAGTRIDLTGGELPPSCSVLAESTTDGEGRFEFVDVPLARSWWLVVPGKQDAKSRSFVLHLAEPHEMHLRIESKEGKPILDILPQ